MRPPAARLFFAIWPPAGTAAALAEWASARQGRATPADKIHLTLAFLGGAAVERASAAARRVEGRGHALPMEVARYWRHNRILWAGPRETPQALQALAGALRFALCRAEFILERRPFAAHVTLVRNAAPPGALPPLPAAPWPVREFTLVRSVVSAAGSAYEVVARFPLAPEGG